MRAIHSDQDQSLLREAGGSCAASQTAPASAPTRRIVGQWTDVKSMGKLGLALISIGTLSMIYYVHTSQSQSKKASLGLFML